VPNILLVLEYNGSRFNGWQKQPRGTRTIQEELHKALERIVREKIRVVHVSGRTDAGVHARAQVANFEVSKVPDLRRLAHSVSSFLRGEVAVLRAFEVPESFHAGDSALRKCYAYTILHRDTPAVLDWGRVWHLHGRLDLDLMQREAAVLLGVHDFSSFRSSDCSRKTSVREIYRSEVVREGEYLKYYVVGSGFLKQMVRNLVGTLVDRARGRLTRSMAEILELRDRRMAGVAAPACGLCLEWVEYPPEIMRLLQGEERANARS